MASMPRIQTHYRSDWGRILEEWPKRCCLATSIRNRTFGTLGDGGGFINGNRHYYTPRRLSLPIHVPSSSGLLAGLVGFQNP
jgi:hypothetical protein